ncbi:Nucleotide-diphospho-sugar transferases superfamily protein [Hibiscus syriacus]|uniref:E3 ubiquitin-protein ligase RMA n=1 Tax=Hibiscus syriacus TaxID=106335 RepID=A0A6A3AGU4_HIBSY|nr:E3 ubiquitin-protein ligase RNF185-like [Hibiscus syriacus]KAE8703800.1 Nucleotide-diphospho-sugar transferases superfamily protein [Hibiscus syriacus]
MASGFGESTSIPPPRQSCSSSINANDAGDFECNICFELAHDPIVTLCGHLFCWPCLYRWLHHHSHCQECPVCKALIQEEKLVPLYGTGQSQTDPRSKSYPDMEIPNRPAGQRPTTAPPPPPETNQFANYGFGLMGGFVPMATARIGNFTMGFGGLLPSLFNIQFHGYPDPAVYGFHTFHGAHAHGFPPPTTQGQQADNVLKNLLLLIGVFVVLALLYW